MLTIGPYVVSYLELPNVQVLELEPGPGVVHRAENVGRVPPAICVDDGTARVELGKSRQVVYLGMEKWGR